jgi:hypothetical protein
MHLTLQLQGTENQPLVESMKGLCHGIGRSDGPCGLLTGGACALSLLGHKNGAPIQMLEPMLNEYASWFYDRVEGYGGYDCDNVAQGLNAKKPGDAMPDPVACGALLSECWGKILELAESYEIMP